MDKAFPKTRSVQQKSPLSLSAFSRPVSPPQKLRACIFIHRNDVAVLFILVAICRYVRMLFRSWEEFCIADELICCKQAEVYGIEESKPGKRMAVCC